MYGLTRKNNGGPRTGCLMKYSKVQASYNPSSERGGVINSGLNGIIY